MYNILKKLARNVKKQTGKAKPPSQSLGLNEWNTPGQRIKI